MKSYHKGAVSLFIVIFTTLLITVITVSFIRLTIRSEQQSNTVDLSASALDSAQAGVEDAKRAILRYETICADRPAAECTAARALIDSSTCNAALSGVAVEANGEVLVRQTVGDTATALDQAYTCVTITRNTDDFLGTIPADDSKTVPLRGVSDFDRVRIDWFTSSNIGGGETNVNLQTFSSLAGSTIPLYQNANYPKNRPSLLRAQLVQVGSTFRIDDIANPSNASTIFLYPYGSAAAVASTPTYPFADGARLTPVKAPKLTECRTSLATGGYACSVILTLPAVSGQRTAMLHLMPLYNAADFRVQLYNGSTLVKFSDVQPSIDSTGRANDLFRRVQVRVEHPDTYPYPNAELEVSGNVCKAFSITDKTEEYSVSTSCKP